MALNTALARCSRTSILVKLSASERGAGRGAGAPLDAPLGLVGTEPGARPLDHKVACNARGHSVRGRAEE